jgi:SAM-dependent methyltransferase
MEGRPVNWLADLPDFGPCGRALDVATGAGRFARMLATRCGEVVGVDRDVSRAEPGAGVSYMAMDAERLDFEDASFDLVAIAWALHHLANPTRVLLEMRRVLKPGGTFLIVEPIRVWTGTNQDHHLAAHLLLARRDAAQGLAHFPIFERLQVSSVIQGLGLTDLGFEALLAVPEEADWDLARCREAGEPWVVRLDAMAGDMEVPADWRNEARELAGTIRAEGLRTSPMHRTYGRLPAWVGAASL